MGNGVLPAVTITLLSIATLRSTTHAAGLLTACNYTTLATQIPHVAPFEGVFNGETVRLDCEAQYQPIEQVQYAQCTAGEWSWPPEFRCLPAGFCKLPAKHGPTFKVIHSSHEKRLKFGTDIFADGENVLIKCRIDNDTHNFACKRGEWSPPIIPCKLPICKGMPVLPNGDFLRVSTEVLEPFCAEGFQLKGTATVFCRNGDWAVKRTEVWPSCERVEVLRTPNSPLQKYQWIAISAGVVILLAVILTSVWCHLRRESPKRNRLMHQTSHVDELLHLRRTKPIVIPDPVSHTQVHYTQDRKPIPVTSL